jgi:hypothetical protein
MQVATISKWSTLSLGGGDGKIQYRGNVAIVVGIALYLYAIDDSRRIFRIIWKKIKACSYYPHSASFTIELTSAARRRCVF